MEGSQEDLLLSKQVEDLEYTIMMEWNEVESLGQKFVGGSQGLFKTWRKDEEGQVIQVQCPSLYIQKLRGLYLLLWDKALQQKMTVFSNAMNKIKHWFYSSRETSKVLQKYMAQFSSFIRFGSESNPLFATLDKYPIMDEVLIDAIMEHCGRAGNPTVDDNYNLKLYLEALGLKCQVTTFYELEIEGWTLKVSDEIIQIRREGEFSCVALESSNVVAPHERMFDSLDHSYIKQLNLQEEEPKPRLTTPHFQSLAGDIDAIITRIQTEIGQLSMLPKPQPPNKRIHQLSQTPKIPSHHYTPSTPAAIIPRIPSTQLFQPKPQKPPVKKINFFYS